MKALICPNYFSLSSASSIIHWPMFQKIGRLALEYLKTSPRSCLVSVWKAEVPHTLLVAPILHHDLSKMVSFGWRSTWKGALLCFWWDMIVRNFKADSYLMYISDFCWDLSSPWLLIFWVATYTGSAVDAWEAMGKRCRKAVMAALQSTRWELFALRVSSGISGGINIWGGNQMGEVDCLPWCGLLHPLTWRLGQRQRLSKSECLLAERLA
jgi:hypothetical protein